MNKFLTQATGTLASLIEQNATLMWVVPFRREVYVTVCENHSGGPASPHTVDCFVPYMLSDMGDTE